ncbi:MAG: carboxypeptidase regulatory-like domain-containing protein, partial [Dehalococcoidia bacterium]|nr:carboxypeptidase regulatory-like domain-containing protein [Dehalococcoidia bacterium]
HAVAPGTGRAYREVRLPVEGVVELELPDDRSAAIHVKHGLTGAPVPGAEVYLGGGGTQPMPHGRGCLPPYPDLRTDTQGRLVVSGLPQGYVSVVARAPGLALRSNGMTVEGVFLKPDEGEATVTLFPYRAVRFPIVAADVGAPPQGAILEVRRYQPLSGYDVGEPLARVEDGQLVLAPFPPGFDRGHVVTPDGRWAMWTAPVDTDVGEPVAFRKIHDVRVKLLWKDGTPAAEQVLWVLLRPRGTSGKVRTAADGSGVFPRCVAETATLLWTPVEEGFGMPIGGVSLLTDPGLLTVTIDRPIDIVLRLLRAGTPGIPAGIQVRVPDLATGGNRSLGREIQEDATTGELRFRWLPMPDGSAPPVTLRADGVPEVTVRPERAADGVWRADAELAMGATLRVRVASPAGGRYWLQLERWDEIQQRWWSMHDHPAYVAGRQAVDGLHVMPGLPPGRYRLVEAYSNLASVP